MGQDTRSWQRVRIHAFEKYEFGVAACALVLTTLSMSFAQGTTDMTTANSFVNIHCIFLFYTLSYIFREREIYKNAPTAVICASLCPEKLPGVNVRLFPGSFPRDELGDESGRFP